VRLFLDTSVLLSASCSANGASRFVLTAAADQGWELVAGGGPLAGSSFERRSHGSPTTLIRIPTRLREVLRATVSRFVIACARERRIRGASPCSL
jgi:hypothetical protein